MASQAESILLGQFLRPQRRRQKIYTIVNGNMLYSNASMPCWLRTWLIVPWDENDPGKAAAELRATIRNTLPDDAILEDLE